MTHRNEIQRQPLRCGLYCRGEGGLSEASVVGPHDELLLLLDPGAESGGALVVELWRGDRLRDRRAGTLTGPAVLRLRRGDRPGASARLTCRVVLDGLEVFRRTVLLDVPAADAQGRLPGGSPRPASDATLLAYAEELRVRLIAPRQAGENGEANGVR